MPWLLFAFGALATVSSPSDFLKRRGLDPGPPGARVAMARTLRFINTYAHVGITYRKQNGPFRLDAVADASHANEIHHASSHTARSRSGGCIKANGGVAFPVNV